MRVPFIKSPLPWILLFGLAAILLVWLARPKAVSVRLADGSVFKLERVVYESQSRRSIRFRWIESFRRGLADALSLPVFTRSAPPDSVVFWVSRRESGTGRYRDFDWWSSAEAVDGHGCRFFGTQLQANAPRWSASGKPMPKAPANAKYILGSGVLPAFPRREKTFKLRFYDAQSALVAELEVPNPVYRSYPTWTAEEFPITHQAGDLTATLLSLSNRWAKSWDSAEAKSFSLTPHLRLGKGDSPVADWELAGSSVEDATGNRSGTWDPFGFPRPFMRASSTLGRAFAGGTRSRSDTPPFVFCTNESAWKLNASFFRTAQAQFASNETWILTNLTIPTNGTAKTFNLSNTWQGVAAKICALTGPGIFTFSNGVPVSAAPSVAGRFTGGSGGSSSRSVGGTTMSEMRWDSGQPKILVQVTGLDADLRFDCLARQAGVTSACQFSGGSNEYLAMNLDVADPASPLDLIFVVQRPRVMEFLVRPPPPIRSLP